MKFIDLILEPFIKVVDIFPQILDTHLPDIGTFLLLAMAHFWPIFNPFPIANIFYGRPLLWFLVKCGSL